MIEYSEFYETNVQATNDNLPETIDTELNEYKNLIQQLGYAHFDD